MDSILCSPTTLQKGFNVFWLYRTIAEVKTQRLSNSLFYQFNIPANLTLIFVDVAVNSPVLELPNQ